MSRPGREDESVLIVGGGPAAAATAESYRDHGGRGRVTLLGSEPHPPYERPPLSKDYLRGESGADDLPIHDPAWYAEHDIELKLGVAARSLDLAAGRVIDETDLSWSFDRCVIATGSRPALPDVPGLDLMGVRFLRTIEDSDWLASQTGPETDVVVVGSGFIGCEIAASMSMRGASVQMVTMEERPQADRLGEDASARIASWLEECDVEVAGGATLREIEARDRRLVTRVDGGPAEEFESDLVVVALGVERSMGWLEGAGLAIEEDAVRVDASMQANGGAVLAAGDIAFAENAAAGRPLRVEHWGEALNQGEIAGATLAGAEARWDTAPGFWSTIGEHTMKQVAWGDGWDEARLEEHDGGAFTVRYEREGELVGVLSHDRDEDYEEGKRILEGVA